VEAIRPVANANDLDAVIGMRGPVAPPTMCNGMMVPILVFDQIYSFDRPTLIKAIPKPERMDEEQFGPTADELFTRIMQMTDNAGATDEHRALNYLAMRYPAIYARAAEQFALDFSMTGSRGAACAPEQYAPDGRSHLFVHKPQHGFHGEVFRTRGCERGVPIPGEEAAALL
jgi:hypothetical protein